MKLQGVPIAGVMTAKQIRATDATRRPELSFRELLSSQWPGAAAAQGSDGANAEPRTSEKEEPAPGAAGEKAESAVKREPKPCGAECGEAEEEKNLEETETNEHALSAALAEVMGPPAVTAPGAAAEEDAPLIEDVAFQPDFPDGRATERESEAAAPRKDAGLAEASAKEGGDSTQGAARPDIISATAALPESVETADSAKSAPSAPSAPDLAQTQDRFDELVNQAAKELQSVQEGLQRQNARGQEPETPQDGEIMRADSNSEAPENPADEKQKVPQARETSERPRAVRDAIERAISRRTPQTEEYISQAPETPAGTAPKTAAPLTAESVRQAFAPPPEEQIKANVLENLENKKMEFSMRLRPSGLGEIDVRMVMENEKLAVYIVAAAVKTAEALQKQSDGLIASLRMANVQVETVQIVQQAENKEGHMDGAFSMFSHQSGGGERQREGHSGGRSGFTGDAGGENEKEQKPERLLDTAV